MWETNQSFCAKNLVENWILVGNSVPLILDAFRKFISLIKVNEINNLFANTIYRYIEINKIQVYCVESSAQSTCKYDIWPEMVFMVSIHYSYIVIRNQKNNFLSFINPNSFIVQYCISKTILIVFILGYNFIQWCPDPIFKRPDPEHHWILFYCIMDFIKSNSKLLNIK